MIIRGALIAIGVATIAATVSARQMIAVSLEGDPLEGVVGKITKNGQVAIDGSLMPLDEFREIVASGPNSNPGPGTSGSELILVNGSRLRALSITLEDEDFLLKTEKMGEVRIPIDLVRAARFRLGFSEPRFEEAIVRSIEEVEEDTFFLVQDKGEVLEVAGFVESIDDEKIVFERSDNGKLEDVIPARVHGVGFVTPWRKKGGEPAYRVTLVDGSRVAGRALSRDEGGPLLVSAEAGMEFTIPWEAVRRIGVRSPRLLYLSDAESKFTKEESILSLDREWQRDLSVNAAPMQMGGKIYEKGLGVSSGTRLDFDCSDYDRFIALLGIDVSAAGRGDCEFVVRVDGRETNRIRVAGGQELVPLKVDLAGGERLSLIVEPGADLDLADFANWADASLVQLR